MNAWRYRKTGSTREIDKYKGHLSQEIKKYLQAINECITLMKSIAH
ncbi:hypothetical protein ESCAB7627_3244 [Escherichia albertii TW07627]|uniref:Uncharacterized protein n=1 Tax=Escherichia albertii (strain TW07627) TaxID=502347 RepID=A0ABC9NMN3_ESCAT|nr:hypothetical protein ESCAB7627_3244 [Escherichia albertii TW07627]